MDKMTIGIIIILIWFSIGIGMMTNLFHISGYITKEEKNKLFLLSPVFNLFGIFVAKIENRLERYFDDDKYAIDRINRIDEMVYKDMERPDTVVYKGGNVIEQTSSEKETGYNRGYRLRTDNGGRD